MCWNRPWSCPVRRTRRAKVSTRINVFSKFLFGCQFASAARSHACRRGSNGGRWPAKTFTSLDALKVDSLQQHRQFRGLKLHAGGCILVRRQLEGAFLKSLMPKTKSILFPVQYLHPVLPPADEQKQIPGEGVVPEKLLHRRRQGIKPAPHVRRSHTQIDAHRHLPIQFPHARQLQHRSSPSCSRRPPRSSSTHSTSLSICRSTDPVTRTRRCPDQTTPPRPADAGPDLS